MNPQIHKIYLIFTTDIVGEDAAEVDVENIEGKTHKFVTGGHEVKKSANSENTKIPDTCSACSRVKNYKHLKLKV
jgi:hypothetical protein